jgi:hypothetical protein
LLRPLTLTESLISFSSRSICTEDQYGNGYHYDAAMKAANDEGYEPRLAFDENDSGGKAILDHFVWDSASTVKVSNE